MKKLMTSALLMMLTTVLAFGQYTVSGKVVNSESEDPLYGVNVRLVNTRLGTTTNLEGAFTIPSVPQGSYKLRVSYVGYEVLEQDIDVNGNASLALSLKPKVNQLSDVIVTGTRADENTPTTYTNVDSEELAKQNLGQDLPFLLNWTPSTVVTSDAGAGVGYTGIRIRGSDPTRINVTINGIPVNDSESQGVFWVNMPDFASSVGSIQVQRGVGTSTNGAGAFGASINMLTNGVQSEPTARVNTSVGSFNTQRYNAIYSTGLLNGKWAFEGRLSNISSDGFIDRGAADLNSYYVSGGYFGDKTSLQFIHFGGNEVTYQSWNGVPQARLENDAAGIEAVIANNGYSPAQAENLRNSGRSFNLYQYDNQVDDYGQDHYQLHFSQELSSRLNLNTALHYTKGAGFFEEFREDDDFSDYGFPDLTIGGATISSTDLIRRRWLDNDFYGLTYNFDYDGGDFQAVLGGAYNEYDGRHFGEIIWSEFAGDLNIRDRWYESRSDKSDFNTYFKANYQVGEKLNLFADAQIRAVSYVGNGTDNDLRQINFDENWTFFNPKVGATYALNNTTSIYGSFAVGNKEPNRSDIIDAPPGTTPVHETLNNLEIGFKKQTSDMVFEANYYLMDYNNQLVLTGEVNDVGAGIRTNVPDSYRMGLELAAGQQLNSWFRWQANLSLSRNKIRQFEELILDFIPGPGQSGEVRTLFEDTDISFSPNIVAGGQFTFIPSEDFEITWLSKYVGDQFLDNTSNENRRIDAFFVNDLRLNYSFSTQFIPRVNIDLLVNNLLNVEYETNGYTFGYFLGRNTEIRENWLYPQAGTNFLLSLGLNF